MPIEIPDATLIKFIPEQGDYTRWRHSRSGWIFPDGSLVPCPIMQHFTVVPETYREYREHQLQLHDESMEEQLAELEPDEHPELHRFDPEGDADEDLTQKLYDDDYVRIGVSRIGGLDLGQVRRGRLNDVTIELYGNMSSFRKHKYSIGILCAALCCEEFSALDTLRRYKFRAYRVKDL